MTIRAIFFRFVILSVLLFASHLNLQAESAEDSNDSSPKIHLNGEGGLAFFDTGSQGQYPNNEFRADEAKLFVEAGVWNDVYVFAELNLITRESNEDYFELGELYVEFESVSKIWNKERMLNVRFGRFDIPFGEEYLTRDAIDNPLISHSLSDFWGVDEGLELYGSMKRLDYIFAVQNGGEPVLRDFNPDKAVVGRITYNWTGRTHLGFSAMRTGALDVQKDRLSELWFGNGFIRALGSPAGATEFRANLFQGDGHVDWGQGHLHANAGRLHYEDNDTVADNQRDVHYYHIEVVQNITNKKRTLYAAARFSSITADKGFPLVGHGSFGPFFFSDSHLTESLWRLSLGSGYRVGQNLLLKIDYTLEHGREVNGSKRDEENFFGVEVAVKF